MPSLVLLGVGSRSAATVPSHSSLALALLNSTRRWLARSLPKSVSHTRRRQSLQPLPAGGRPLCHQDSGAQSLPSHERGPNQTVSVILPLAAAPHGTSRVHARDSRGTIRRMTVYRARQTWEGSSHT